ncbi:hypothetical protein [Streptomyces sp. NPDC001744]|uniref:hypothetical protein n=1 Tax=Streptomyces sp. NPDC001744 TaxID=3364606 RepID=UPI0036C3A739
MRKRTRRSTAVAALALACAAGLLGGEPAFAAEFPYTAAEPTARPGGCVTGGELPWVGNTDVSLSVRTVGETSDGHSLDARFRVWKEGAAETPVVDVAVATSLGSVATLVVPKDRIPAEGPYWWQARVERAGGASAWTAPCGFGTDQTRPAAPAVEFLDTASYPNGAPSGTVRTVRVSLPAGTEAAYFCLDPLVATGTYGCAADRRVPVGADGTTTTTFVTPERTGPASVWVRAFDRAGNLSDTAHADYWVTSPFIEPFGDYDSDGRPDLLGVDAAGRLTLLAGLEGGGFAAPAVADTRDWTDTRVARAGRLINRYGQQEANDVRNDLVALRNGRLYAYPGNGEGGFGEPVEIAGFDWSGVTRFALSTQDYGNPGLVVVKNGQLLHFDVHTSGNGIRVAEPAVLAASGWDTKELVASDTNPGALPGTYWARDTRSGTLEFFGVDYGTETPYALVAPVTVAASGFGVRQVPSLVAVGDLTGDERIDLVTGDRRGGLALRPVRADGAPAAPEAVRGAVPAGTRLF